MELAAQRENLASYERAIRPARARRSPRRDRRTGQLGAALVLARILASVPLSLLATDRFHDVPTSNPHHDDVNPIAAAGITIGFSDATYKPDAFVTRGQMASFLARTAGLGGRTRVVNAATALSANTATNATNATNAQIAVNAQSANTANSATRADSAGRADSAASAATATNAEQLGGQPPSAYLRATGDMMIRYSFYNFIAITPGTNLVHFDGPMTEVSRTDAGPSGVRLPLDRPFTAANLQRIRLYSVTLTLTPTTAGASEEPVPGGRGDEGARDR